MRKKISVMLTALLVLVAAFSGCAGGSSPALSEQKVEKPVAVSVTKAAKATVEVVSTLSGKVKPAQEVSIIPKISGKVAGINFEVGDKVKEGDVLFYLDDNDIKLQVQQAEAALSIAESALERTKGGSVEQQLSQLKSSLVSAETAYNDAKLNYERLKSLFEVGGISREALESAETRLKVAEEQYKTAKTSYDLTLSKINPENIAGAEAQVKQARAAYDIAKSQLENTIVKSPVAGVVASRNIDVGEMVGTMAAAMSIVDLSYVTVDVNVPETIINKINQNDPVDVLIKSVSNEPLRGQVMSVSPAADPQTQNYTVKIKVPNDEGLLKGGMFAEIKIGVDKAENVLSVPLSAVIDDNGRKVVYVVKGDKAEKREISIGFSNNELVQVLSGVSEGEEVVVKGQNLLSDGSKVTVVER